MKRLVVASTLLVMLGMMATATSAIAVPEIGRCVARAGGPYRDSNCRERAFSTNEKRFAWEKNPLKHHFALSSPPGGVSTWETEKAKTRLLICHTGAATGGGGEYVTTGSTPTTKTLGHLEYLWQECEAPGAGKCTTFGQAVAGIVTTKPLTGKLDYLSGKGTASPVVGTQLVAEAGGKAGTAMEWTCENGTGERLVGCFSSTIEPVKTMASQWTLRFNGPQVLPSGQHCNPSGGGENLNLNEYHSATPETMKFFVGNEEALELKA